MSSTRLAPLPIDHLDAELAAFPLASEAALELAPIELHPQLENPTGSLWRAAERDLLGAWPAVGLDECVNLRDRLWFRTVEPEMGQRRPVPLARHLRKLAGNALAHRGTVAVPRIQPDFAEPPQDDLDSRARSAWRWLSFALPPDLLLAALGGDNNPHVVNLLDPTLSRVLADRGYSEPHLHLGAALDFPLFWVTTLRVLGEPDCRLDAFSSPGAYLGEGQDLGSWLIRAAHARYLLAAFLDSAASSFRDFLLRETARLACALGASGTATLAMALRELERGRLGGNCSPGGKLSHATLRALYQRSVPRLRCRLDHPDDIWHADPIAPLVPWSRLRGSTPEIGFVSRALKYLDSDSQKVRADQDSRFARLFWQTVRVRCLYYRHVVQRPLTPGLQWFLRSFDRMKTGRRLVSERLKTESALQLDKHESGLRSVEIRTSPESSCSEMSVLVRAIDGVRRARPANRRRSPLLNAALVLGRSVNTHERNPQELGLVLHFPRDRGGEWSRGRPAAFWKNSNADPSYDPQKPRQGNSLGFRYARFYLRTRRAARALSRYLLAFPASLAVIRGLDLCADETGVPTWVLAPLLRHVHDAGEAASRVLRECFGRDVPPLRTSVHTGEDFIHLLTGLRSIDQSIERFRLRPGDRLGHALALGVDPEEWSRRAGRIVMPREDRLFDLLWEWRWYAQMGGAPSSRLEMLHREMAIHAEEMFEDSVAPRDLEKLDDLLHREMALRLLGYPSRPRPGKASDADNSWGKKRLDLAARYLRSSRVFSRGREIVRVDPSKEAESLSVLQAGLRGKVSTRGIAIEVNPSSNLLIAHLGELKDHPLWRLRPPDRSGDLAPLSICIGSDDPLTFATRLPEEYQHLYDAMILAGYSESEAHRWLDDARQAGLDARFTLPVTEPFLEIEPWLLGSGPAIAPPP